MIELINVCKSFNNKYVLKNINLKFNNNQTYIILGPSGAGKTMLVKLIVGFHKCDLGKIIFDGQDITNFNEEELFRIRKKCTLNFQLPALLKHKTIFSNLALPLTWEGKNYDLANEKVTQALKTVGLEYIIDKYPFELSYGIEKMVSIARTLIINPEYIIFDEPTSGLDPLTAIKIFELIKFISKELHKGVIIVTHDLKSANILEGEYFILDNGIIDFRGTEKDFKNISNKKIESFIDGTSI